MSKQLLITMAIGLAVIVGGIFLVFSSTKSAHLELKGEILKIRTGQLDEHTSAAMVDFRVENPSNIPFVVRDITAKLEKQDGTTIDGLLVSRSDVKQLLAYNKFLGKQYNETLTVQDRVGAHATVDRMIAASFEVPQQELDHAKAIHLEIEDVDGAIFQTAHAPQ